MRVEFLTDDNPRYVLPFFVEFIRQYAGEFEITRISCCRAMGRRSRLQLLRELLLLYSPVGLVRILVSIAAAKLLGLVHISRGAKRFHTIAQLCKAYGISCEHIRNPNDEEFLSGVEARHPDVIASVACPYILK